MNPPTSVYTYPPPQPSQLAYQVPYPPPPQQPFSTPDQLPPYPYPPQAPQPVQQHRPQYFGHSRSQYAQSTVAASASPQLRSNLLRNEQSSPPSSPEVGPGAAGSTGHEVASPEMEDYEANLVNALGSNDQQQNAEQHDDGDSEPVFNLPPPPESTYPDEQELEKAMHAWTLEHGYEVVRRASKKNAKGLLYKRYYHCSKHGENHRTLAAEDRRRVNRKSNRLNCPMSVAVVALDPSNPDGQWQIRHRKTHHNHGPLDALQMAGHRRRARGGGVEKAVDGLFAIGTSTAQVMQFLQKTNPNGLFTRTDVANMKLKWRKWGTCADRLPQRAEQQRQSKTGVPSACQTCRQKKIACDSQRPVCNQCIQHRTECQYEHEALEEEDLQMNDDPSTSPVDLTTSTPAIQQQILPNEQTPADTAPSKKGRITNQKVAETQRILQTLQSFTQETIRPTRLTLQSSSVEILAHSSCGNGDTYRSLPILQSYDGWQAFRDAVIEATRKENTYEVLTGSKTEPEKPSTPPGEEFDVEIWNEYIKQLAIYNRRNELLLTAFSSRLGPTFKHRVQGLAKAADIWATLEDICAPQGSEAGFKLFFELHSISLANSQGLQDYIRRLQTVYHQFAQMKINTSPPPLSKKLEQLPIAASGKDAMPEEMMCFLFLKSLGEEWRAWVDGLCATNNIGGFGTGERLGFKELCKRALGHETMQRRELRKSK